MSVTGRRVPCETAEQAPTPLAEPCAVGQVARRLIEAGHKPRLLVRNVDKARECASKADIVRITRNDQRR